MQIGSTPAGAATVGVTTDGMTEPTSGTCTFVGLVELEGGALRPTAVDRELVNAGRREFEFEHEVRALQTNGGGRVHDAACGSQTFGDRRTVLGADDAGRSARRAPPVRRR